VSRKILFLYIAEIYAGIKNIVRIFPGRLKPSTPVSSHMLVPVAYFFSLPYTHTYSFLRFIPLPPRSTYEVEMVCLKGPPLRL